MKKHNLGRFAAILVIGMAAAATSFAGDSLTGKTSFGFQGVAAGNLLNGASVRSWTNGNFGWEGNLFYGSMKISPEGTQDYKADLLGLEGKGMWSLIQRTNSKFYLGGKLAYGTYSFDQDGSSEKLLDGKVLQVGILAGAEFCIPQLPEVGFNFEVGYNFTNASNTLEGDDLDMKLHGINAAIGIHYYF